MNPIFLPQNYVKLDDANAGIDFSPVELQFHRYRRNGGKKSLEERKADFRQDILRNVISSFIGEPGTTPPRDVADLPALKANVDIFIKYVTDTRKENGGIMKSGSYASFRASFTYLFSVKLVYNLRAFDEQLKEDTEGVKEHWYCLHQAYQKFDDCFEIAFAHSKDQQTGDNAIKKLPRHCYANPLNFSSDLPSALFHYFALNPHVISNSEESLFPGSITAQVQRFGRYVAKICVKYQQIIEDEFAFDIKDIGVNSWRKCAHTKLNCGSTAGPSGPAACIRGGHSMGANRDVYIAQEKASDTYCGRILVGLPVHAAEFAVSYPDFVPIDPDQSVRGGVSSQQLADRMKEVDKDIMDVMESIFGRENLDKFPTIRNFLRIGLASHCIHMHRFEHAVGRNDSRPIIPSHSPLHHTPLFTNLLIDELKEHVRIAMPWESENFLNPDGTTFFKPATGLPPHVTIFAYIKGLEQQMENMPSRIEEILDKRQMSGPLSLDQIVVAVENGPRMKAIAEDLAAMRRRVIRGSSDGDGEENGNAYSARPRHLVNAWLIQQYKHSDGKYRRVPSSWKVPLLPMQPMYVYWHCGDEKNNIPPMKYLTPDDIKFLNKRAHISLSELKKVMTVIDKFAKEQGFPPREHMSQRDANTCYYRGERAIYDIVPENTPKGRPRVITSMKWATVVKYMHKKRVPNE
eukprot:CCRYP_020133-RA/>CCRYP_020133-RA protein AED:0.24 eAED:0.24 QI:0/0/0/1/1/1/2/0/687